MLFESLSKNYGLTSAHLASLLSKTEKTLESDLSSNPQLSNAIMDILNTPDKLLKLVTDGKNNLPPTIYAKAVKKLNEEIVLKFNEVFEGNVFIKQVKSNELGFRNGSPGKAGSFILIPKHCIDIFPSLSEDILNANSQITLIIEPENDTRIIEYVYHNSKLVDNDPSGRDEYRLYNNNTLDGYTLLMPEDIIILIKSSTTYTYHLYRYSPNSPEYPTLVKLIEKYKVSRAYASKVPSSELALHNLDIKEVFNFDPTNNDIIESLNLPLINSDTTESFDASPPSSQINTSALQDLLAQGLQNAEADTIVRKIKQIKRDSRFRKIVLSAYNNKCSVTNTSIAFNSLSNIQACHIIGKSFGGSDNPTNGIALSMDLHYAFDNGFFTITDDYAIQVHPKAINIELLSTLDSKKILLPPDSKLHPSKDALAFHRKHVFGQFQN